ncbi:MAG: glycosyltransferase family 9 protein [Candidatus Omnitrophica bacterium]|nr:glycosyltransferase family 9 protein [Candidatus Omnitrophota bacterium]MDD5552690.1 glycosyltransferase family 9 protein [Candidatus Omnitrophota bacterium]
MINKEAVKEVLVFRNDRFGEFLLNIPALRALKETFANARLTAVINPRLEELAAGIPYIDEVILWAPGKHKLAEKFALIKELREKRIDIAVILNPSKDFNLLSFLAGIKIRAGYDRKWGFLLTHRMADKKHLGEKHEIEYNLELVSLLGARTQDKALSLEVKDTGGLLDAEPGKELIALHPWTSDPVKQWPLSNFRRLAERLCAQDKWEVLLIGGAEEAGQAKDSFSGVGGLIDLTGRTSLMQLGAVLKRCGMLISGDSGPVHLACCVNTKVLALFRSDLPGKSARRWGPWGKGHAVIEKPKLSDISVDEVFEKIKQAAA